MLWSTWVQSCFHSFLTGQSNIVQIKLVLVEVAVKLLLEYPLHPNGVK